MMLNFIRSFNRKGQSKSCISKLRNIRIYRMKLLMVVLTSMLICYAICKVISQENDLKLDDKKQPGGERLLQNSTANMSTPIDLYNDDVIIEWMQYIIAKMSIAINSLKRVFVLLALLFLIQNLINFWILASSFVFLPIYLPPFLRNTLQNIYKQYNQPLLQYININISYPIFNPDADTNSAFYFNFATFMLEPSLLMILTLIQLVVLKKIIRVIKKHVKSKRQRLIQRIIQKEITKIKNQRFKLFQNQSALKEKKETKKSFQQKKSKDKKQNKNNKVANEFDLKQEKPQIESENKIIKNIFFNFNQKLFEIRIREQLVQTFKQKKHWSSQIHINILQKMSAIIINYMSGLLIPAYTLIIGNLISNSKQMLNRTIYFLLLGFVLLFPMFYVAILFIHKKRRHKYEKDQEKRERQRKKVMEKQIESLEVVRLVANQQLNNVKESIQPGIEKSEKSWLKNSQVETIWQYYINFLMSISLGISWSPVPFLVTTTTILTFFLLYTFFKGQTSISCKSLSLAKVNQIFHKLTFWLFNFLFLGLAYLSYLKGDAEENHYIQLQEVQIQRLTYYAGIGCLSMFIIGGLHQLFEFACVSLYTICKITYMIYHVCHSEEMQVQEEEEEDGQRDEAVNVPNNTARQQNSRSRRIPKQEKKNRIERQIKRQKGEQKEEKEQKKKERNIFEKQSQDEQKQDHVVGYNWQYEIEVIRNQLLLAEIIREEDQFEQNHRFH